MLFATAHNSRLLKYAAVVGFCALNALVYWNVGLHHGGDGATYILLGRSLKTGHYNRIWEPGAAREPMVPAGYPALLTLTNGTVSQAKAVSFICYIIGLSMACVLAERTKLPRLMKFGAVLVLGMWPVMLNHATQELSDMPYFACSMAALALWDAPVAFTLTAVAAVAIRPHAFLLIFARAITTKDRVRALALVALAGACFLAMSIGRWDMMLVHPGNRDDGIVNLWTGRTRIPQNIGNYAAELTKEFMP